jgi:hypothetical protein
MPALDLLKLRADGPGEAPALFFRPLLGHINRLDF